MSHHCHALPSIGTSKIGASDEARLDTVCLFHTYWGRAPQRSRLVKLKELHNYVYIQANEDTAHRGARSSRIDAEDVFPGRATKEYRDAPC